MSKGEVVKRGKTLSWQKINWKPERLEKEPVYRLFRQFLKANPHMTGARTIDMALARLFAPYSRDAQVLFDADMIKHSPDFSTLEAQHEV